MSAKRSGNWILILAALFGALALLVSAASAHALKAWVEPQSMPRLQTANDYLMYYSLVLLAVGIFYQFRPSPGLLSVARLFGLGIGIFCGSLYILSLTQITWLAWFTPVGGLTLLAGWILLAWEAWGQGRIDD